MKALKYIGVLFIFLLLFTNTLLAQVPTATISTNDADRIVCFGQLVTFQVSVSSMPSNYNISGYAWFINSQPLGSGTSLTNPTFSLNTSGTVYCLVSYFYLSTDINGTVTANQSQFISNTLSFTYFPKAPSFQITGPSQTITNSNVTFSVPSLSNNIEANWLVTGGTITQGQGTSSINVLTSSTPTPINSMQAAVLVTNFASCPASQHPEGVSTSVINFSNRNTPPTIPQGVTVSNPTNSSNSVQVSWQASTDNISVSEYIIYYQEVGTTTPQQFNTGSNATNAILAGLTEAVNYNIWVVAVDNDGLNSSNSATNSYTIDVTPPSAPTNVMYTEVTGSTVALVWNEATDNVRTTAYDIYMNGTLVQSNVARTMYVARPIGTPPNTFTITARDAKGNVSTASIPLVVNKVDPFIIDSVTGFVGIGVQPPSEKLDIDGNLKVRGDIYSNPVTFTGNNSTSTKFMFSGSDFKIYNRNQDINGTPMISLSQWGEVSYWSRIATNYNEIYFLGNGSYKNAIGYSGQYQGPMLVGEKGGALGVRTVNDPHLINKTALYWTEDGTVTKDGTLNLIGTLNSSNQYQGPLLNMNYLGKISNSGRLIFECPMVGGTDANAFSKWGRMILSNNIEWDAQQSKYRILSPTQDADLQMIRYENHGSIAFYTRNMLKSAGVPNDAPLNAYMTQTEMDANYRRMTIRSNGQVLIGNSTYDITDGANTNDKLIVGGNAKVNGDFYVQNKKVEQTFSKIGTTNNIQYTAGNIGIGNNGFVPTSILEINDNSNGWLMRIKGTVTNDGEFVGIKLGTGYPSNTETGKWSGIAAIGIGDHGNSPGLALYSAQTERLRIDNNGNVGIGINAPTAKLHVVGAGGQNIDILTTGRIKSTSGNDGGMWFGDSKFVGAAGANSVGVWNNGIWRMIVDNNGNVGIGTGTSTPISKLHVVGDVTIQGNLSLSILNITTANSGNTLALTASSSFGNVAFNKRVDAPEFRACLSPGTCPPDYVFEKDYKLMELDALKAYLSKNKHLPEVPSANEMLSNGVNMSEMNLTLLKKVEEMTLYIFQLEERLQAIEKNKK